MKKHRAGQLAFLANPKYEEYLYSTKASIIIVNDTQVLKEKIKCHADTGSGCLPRFCFPAFQIPGDDESAAYRNSGACHIFPNRPSWAKMFISGAFAYIGNNVKIGKNVKIYPQVYIGDDVSIGDHSVIYPGVKIYHRCVIGQHVTIHAGSVIGADGFGFAPQSDGSFKKIPQMGNVVIEDFVEVGSNATIDRATIGSTIIKKGAKLDNLIQIAHNVEIGKQYRNCSPERCFGQY